MEIAVKLPTLAEYQAAFAKEPVEIVDGEFIVMAAAHARVHPRVIRKLNRSLDKFVQDHNLGEVFIEASFVLDGNRRKDWVRGARMPDLAFIARERVEKHEAENLDPDEPWWLAPDIAAEVISHTDAYADLSQKVADYLRFGVQIVWMIDPRQRIVRVHTPAQPTGFTLHEADTLKAEPLVAGWSLSVADLFAG